MGLFKIKLGIALLLECSKIQHGYHQHILDRIQADNAGDHNPAKISSNKLLYILREFVLFDVSLLIYKHSYTRCQHVSHIYIYIRVP